MHELKFLHPEFIIDSENTTVRRGVKWAMRDGETVAVQTGVGKEAYSTISTMVCRFCDLTGFDIALQHDKQTRTLQGLYDAMVRAYPGFDKKEIVTVITFYVPSER